MAKPRNPHRIRWIWPHVIIITLVFIFPVVLMIIFSMFTLFALPVNDSANFMVLLYAFSLIAKASAYKSLASFTFLGIGVVQTIALRRSLRKPGLWILSYLPIFGINLLAPAYLKDLNQDALTTVGISIVVIPILIICMFMTVIAGLQSWILMGQGGFKPLQWFIAQLGGTIALVALQLGGLYWILLGILQSRLPGSALDSYSTLAIAVGAIMLGCTLLGGLVYAFVTKLALSEALPALLTEHAELASQPELQVPSHDRV